MKQKPKRQLVDCCAYSQQAHTEHPLTTSAAAAAAEYHLQVSCLEPIPLLPLSIVPVGMQTLAGDVVLDCGANVGSFARIAAPVLGPRGTIYCLEPIPDVCAALQLNSTIYQQWADRKGLQIAKVVPIQAGEGDVLV